MKSTDFCSLLLCFGLHLKYPPRPRVEGLVVRLRHYGRVVEFLGGVLHGSMSLNEFIDLYKKRTMKLVEIILSGGGGGEEQ
jgi:ribosomal protein S1